MGIRPEPVLVVITTVKPASITFWRVSLCPGVVDPAPAAAIEAEVYPHLDIVAPNQTEAEFYTGIAVDGVEAAAKAAAVLRGKGVRVAIIKMAELGVYFEADAGSGFVPPFCIDAVDTTSAGDAFHGALAVALGEGKSLENGIRFGAAAGALAVTRPGVQNAMPDRAAVEALLNSPS